MIDANNNTTKDTTIDTTKVQTNKFLNNLMKIPENIGTPVSLVIHTIIFVVFLVLPLFGFEAEKVQIFFTTILSLEAIYLAIFIQMSVNQSNQNIQDLSEDIDDIQDDIEDIQGDIDYMTDIDEMNDVSSSVNHHATMNEQITLLQKQIHAMSVMIDRIKDEAKK